MSSLLSLFATFHTSSKAVPMEILREIMDYATEEGRNPKPYWSNNQASPLILVSTAFRAAYEDLPITGGYGIPHTPFERNPYLDVPAALVPRVRAISNALAEVHDLDVRYTIPAAIEILEDPDNLDHIGKVNERLTDNWQRMEYFGEDSDPADELEHDEWKAQPVLWRPTIRNSLFFPDLYSMLRFFRNGPAQDTSSRAALKAITFISVRYDDYALGAPRRGRPGEHFQEAYGAFDALHQYCHLLSLERLQIDTGSFGDHDMSHESPGMWNLLKLRGLRQVMLTGYFWRGLKFGDVVRRQLTQPVGTPWVPLGIENPGRKEWDDMQGNSTVEKKRKWLDKRYRDTQDWEVKDARCKRRRLAHDKRKGISKMKQTRRSNAAELARTWNQS